MDTDTFSIWPSKDCSGQLLHYFTRGGIVRPKSRQLAVWSKGFPGHSVGFMILPSISLLLLLCHQAAVVT